MQLYKIYRIAFNQNVFKSKIKNKKFKHPLNIQKFKINKFNVIF